MSRDDLISTREAAEILGITMALVQRYIIQGRLPAQKIGKLYVLRRGDVEAFERPGPGRPPSEKEL